MERIQTITNKSAPRCPYCHETVGASATKTGCEECMAWHHKECWTEHGGCSACGFQSRERPHVTVPVPMSTRELRAGAPTVASTLNNESERSCADSVCNNQTQDLVEAYVYKRLCLAHAQKLCESKLRRQNLIISISGIGLVLSAIASVQTPGRNGEIFAIPLFISLFFLAVAWLERRSQTRSLKSLDQSDADTE